MDPTIQPMRSEDVPRVLRPSLSELEESAPMSRGLFLTAARAPVVLESLHCLMRAARRSAVPAGLREAISLRVSQLNQCEYGLAANSQSARRAGADAAFVLDSRHGIATNPRWQALLSLATKVVEDRGRHASLAVALARDAGATDFEVLEVVQLVALGIFMDYLGNVAGTVPDAPSVGSTLPAEPGMNRRNRNEVNGPRAPRLAARRSKRGEDHDQ